MKKTNIILTETHMLFRLARQGGCGGVWVFEAVVWVCKWGRFDCSESISAVCLSVGSFYRLWTNNYLERFLSVIVLYRICNPP